MTLRFLVERNVSGVNRRWVKSRTGALVPVRADVPTSSPLFLQAYKAAWNSGQESEPDPVVASYMAHLLRRARDRASKKKMPCTIDVGWLMARYRQQDGRCAVTGVRFELHRDEATFANAFKPSIDRINNSIGYTPQNTRLVLYGVNVGRGAFSQADYLEVCRSVVQAADEAAKPVNNPRPSLQQKV